MRHRMDFPLPPLFWLTIWLTFLVVFASIAGERRDMQQKKKPRYSIEYQGFRLVGMTRFELATTRPPDVYSNRAELHPELVLRRKDSNNFLFIAN